MCRFNKKVWLPLWRIVMGATPALQHHHDFAPFWDSPTRMSLSSLALLFFYFSMRCASFRVFKIGKLAWADMQNSVRCEHVCPCIWLQVCLVSLFAQYVLLCVTFKFQGNWGMKLLANWRVPRGQLSSGVEVQLNPLILTPHAYG